MANEPFAASSLIAFGEIEKLKRAVMPAIMGATAVSDVLGHAFQLTNASKTFSGILGTAGDAKGMSALLDPTRHTPTVLPTATMDSMLFSEATKRAFLAGTAIAGVRSMPELGGTLKLATEIVGQFTKPPWADTLRLLQQQASTMAAAMRAAEAVVDEEVLPEIAGLDEARDHGLASPAREWWDDLPRAQRHVLRSEVGGALLAAGGAMVAAAQGNVPWLMFALLSYWLILYNIYALVDGERERRAQSN